MKKMKRYILGLLTVGLGMLILVQSLRRHKKTASKRKLWSTTVHGVIRK